MYNTLYLLPCEWAVFLIFFYAVSSTSREKEGIMVYMCTCMCIAIHVHVNVTIKCMCMYVPVDKCSSMVEWCGVLSEWVQEPIPSRAEREGGGDGGLLPARLEQLLHSPCVSTRGVGGVDVGMGGRGGERMRVRGWVGWE